MPFHKTLALCLLIAESALLASPDNTQTEDPSQFETKSALTPDGYGRFESLGALVLSPDGRWLAHDVRRVDGDRVLHLRMLATETTDRIKGGYAPRFSRDSKWITYQIAPPKKKPGAPEGKPKTGLRDLVNGETTELEGVARVAFSAGGRWLAIEKTPVKNAGEGRELLVRHLESGLDTYFSQVANWSWSTKDDSALLALVVDAPGKLGNGVRVWDAANNTLRTLESAQTNYHGLTWRRDADDLAVLREKNDATEERTKANSDDNEDDGAKKKQPPKSPDTRYEVFAWSNVGKKAKLRRLNPTASETFPKDQRISRGAGIRWAKEGDGLFLGLKPLTPPPKPKADAKATKPEKATKKSEAETDNTREFSSAVAPNEIDVGTYEEESKKPGKKDSKTAEKPKSLRETLKEPAGVEVWHARDVDIMPLQKRMAGFVENRTRLAAWWFKSQKTVVLSENLADSTRIGPNSRHVLVGSNTPYEEERKFGPTLRDVHVVDAHTAERTLLAKRLKYDYGISPTGRYATYLKDSDLWAYDIKSRTHRNLTEGVDTTFVNTVYMSLTDEKPAWGIAGWTAGDASLWAYDQFDIWELDLAGGEAKRMTNGADEQLTHRRRVLDFTARDTRVIESPVDVWLDLRGYRSKKNGLGRLHGGEFQLLRVVDQRIARFTRARDASVYAWSEETFDDSPDVFVATDDLDNPRQITETNEFLSELHWGRSEVIDYENQNGEQLQGALFYPAGYAPEKRGTYPMIVYIYERRSDEVHRFSIPTEEHPYSPAVYTTRGYFVFQPDIVYRPQNPGLSAVECVVPAVKTVLERGEVDPRRVGLVGHSWGAYQTAFIVTRTKLFAAGIAGAPLTNMMSMSVGVYWNSGQTNAWIFHESQGRMDRPFWRDVETYIANSPIFGIDDLETPLLVAFGDKDGAVDWHQGVELYNAARLAGKQMVMLIYPGENHSLAKKPNRVDYHYRIIEWFGHYLKGDDAPKWITEGTSFIERKKELEKELEKAKKKKG